MCHPDRSLLILSRFDHQPMTQFMKIATSRILILSFLLFSVGCTYQRDRTSANNFATSYVDFSKAVADSEVVMWAIALDQFERPDEDSSTQYRKSLSAAFDWKAPNSSRANAAKEAIRFYNSKSTTFVDDFDERNSKLNESLLAMTQNANAISNPNYRRQAIEIANLAGKIEHTFEALKKCYVNTYDIQLKLLKTMAQENGDLNRVFSEMKIAPEETKKLESEAASLRDEEQMSVQHIREQYAAFKGITGVTLD